eukprot:COSAG05_NODE_5912_length_1060_cov_1.477627_1_plen_291_part_10
MSQEDVVTLTFAGDGKLGIHFGEKGREWPVVVKITPGSLAAQYEIAGALRLGMELLAVADVTGGVSVEGSSFEQGTKVFRDATRPLQLSFRKRPSEGVPPTAATAFDQGTPQRRTGGADAGALYRCVARAAVTQEATFGAARPPVLKYYAVGEMVRLVEFILLRRHTRGRSADGWVSLTAQDGTALMEPAELQLEPAERQCQREPELEPKSEPGFSVGHGPKMEPDMSGQMGASTTAEPQMELQTSRRRSEEVLNTEQPSGATISLGHDIEILQAEKQQLQQQLHQEKMAR